MGSFERARKEELPPGWLADDTAQSYQGVLGREQDRELRRLKDAVMLRWPATADEDALYFIGRDRMLERAPGEALEAWRARCQTALDDAYWWGTKRGDREIFGAFGIPTSDVVVFNNFETNFGEGTEPWWSMKWILVDSSSGPWEADYWDEPDDTWDAADELWDLTMTGAELEYLKRRIRVQKSPGAYPAYLFIALVSEVWDLPADVWDDPGDVWDSAREVTAVNDGADTLTIEGHGFPLFLPITFVSTGALPTPLVEGITYYALEDDLDTILVLDEPAGAPIDLTDTGSGTISVVPLYSPAVVPIRLWPLWDEGVEITGEGLQYWDDGTSWDEGM